MSQFDDVMARRREIQRVAQGGRRARERVERTRRITVGLRFAAEAMRRFGVAAAKYSEQARGRREG